MFKIFIFTRLLQLIGTQGKPQQKESKKITKSDPNLGFQELKFKENPTFAPLSSTIKCLIKNFTKLK